MSSVCAVIVTRNRSRLLGKCLRALAAQSRPFDATVVVDNASTDDTPEMLARDFPCVSAVRLPRNTGGAGGFNAGMTWASQGGFDWAWLADDDAIASRTMLQRMMARAEQADPSAPAAFWCNVVRRDVELLEECPPAETPQSGEQEVDTAMFVGLAVNRAAIQAVGLPRADLFLYNDDSEYCLRLRRAGARIVRVDESVIYHSDWQGSFLRANVLGRDITLPDVPAWKMYYLCRNDILLSRQKGMARWARALAYNLRQAAHAALLRPQQLPHILLAGLHGAMNVRGARMLPPPAGAERGHGSNRQST